MAHQRTILFYLLLTLVVAACTSQGEDRSPATGDLTPTFVEKTNKKPISKVVVEPGNTTPTEVEILVSDGFAPNTPSTGKLPKCYNFTPKSGKLNNYLTINVGGGTDVALKLVSAKSGKAIRYAFINANETYTMRNIPNGVYYTKIAYGHDWYSKVVSGKCKGKFARSAHYEQGEEMNFNIKQNFNGYSIPSFSLTLDMISSDPVNTFNSLEISEDVFNE